MAKLSDLQELFNYIYQNLSVLSNSPIYFYKEQEKIEKDENVRAKVLEGQQKWFKSYLYERKEIEVS